MTILAFKYLQHGYKFPYKFTEHGLRNFKSFALTKSSDKLPGWNVH